MLEEVLAFQERPTLCGATAPTPLVVSISGELGALEAKDRVPDIVPLACGVKATLNDELLPAAIVTGKEVPSRTNWELLVAPEEMVTLVPIALKVTFCVAL